MDLLTAANIFICANVLLILAASISVGIGAVSARLRHPIAYRHQLRFGQALTIAAVLLPFVSAFSSYGHPLPQTAQVWSAPTMQEAGVAAGHGPQIAFSFATSNASMPLDAVSGVAALLFLAGMIFVLVRFVTDAAATMSIIADAQMIRRIGWVRIVVSERIAVPFSFWRPARYFIVVPSVFALRPADFRMAIGHEGQHHRQQDTKLLYFYSLLKAAFFWNPAVHRLEKHLRELQELACDEALSERRRITTEDYCQCLLRVAELATRRRGVSVHVGMVGASASILKTRIEALLSRPANHLGKFVMFFTSAAGLALMGATAFAFTSTINDRRVSAEDAGRMAAVAQQGSDFRIVVNDRVLKQLNLLLATPDGRAHLRASLTRMKAYQVLISEQLVQHGMPLELLAVPLVESGYRNLPQGDDARHGAGLWMFITPTARRFGLTVDENLDERLDVPAETAAAIRYFASLHRQFNDWGLALLGYNAGSARIEKAIRETGSNDVWELITRGHEHDADYLPRVMAAILILENPTVLDALN